MCDDISFDLLLETNEAVEPIVRCIDKWAKTESLFLYCVKREGKELWAMDEKLFRHKEIESLVDLAD